MDFRVTGIGVAAAVVVAAACIALLRKLRAEDEPVDTLFIGKTGDVIAPIGRGRPGKIRIEGREFVAQSTERIEAGSFGEVVGIDGSRVNVVQVPALSSHTTGYHMMEM